MSTRTAWGLAIAVTVCVLALLIALRSESAAPEKNGASSAATESAPPPSVAAPLARLAAPLTSVAPAAPSVPGLLTESELMDSLHQARNSGQLALAIQLARDGNRRFPDSDSAPERASILVHALADVGQRSEARGEAEYMVNHYPDSGWVRDVERFTGAHRRRNVRVNDAGELEQR